MSKELSWGSLDDARRYTGAAAIFHLQPIKLQASGPEVKLQAILCLVDGGAVPHGGHSNTKIPGCVRPDIKMDPF